MQKFIFSLALFGALSFTACTESNQAPENSTAPEANAATVTPAQPTASQSANPAGPAAPAAPATETPPEAKSSALAWNEETHDFGQIPKGIPATFAFEFVNNGEAPVTIADVKPSCGCTAADYSKEAIAPGEKGFVKAEFNAAKEGVFNKSVTVRFGDGSQPALLKLRGEVIAGK